MTERKLAELKVSGMVCAACSSAIEKTLGNLDRVYRAQINLVTELASVEYNPGKLKLADLEKAVNDAEYRVIDESAVIRVGGMVCGMCVKALEIAPQKLDGMVDASVNLAAEKAYVT